MNIVKAAAERRPQQRSLSTRTALVAAARTLFTEAGYHATGTHELVARASLTRGALYYHFSEKSDLFEAVFIEVRDELTSAAHAQAAPMTGDTWRSFVAAVSSYLRLTAERADVQRIMLIDGPAVLGWKRWRELHAPIRDGVVRTMERLAGEGVISVRYPEALAHQILAALNEAALSIAHAERPTSALDEALDALLALLTGLRRPEKG